MISKPILDSMVDGYLECAEWADKPEGSRARFSKAARVTARDKCEEFIKACGPLFDQAIAVDGYSPEHFGRDFWLSRCGHGTGFWDRDELSIKPLQNWYAVDRDGAKYLLSGRGDTLGDYLTAIAYGDSGHISPFAYASLTAYRGWLYFD